MPDEDTRSANRAPLAPSTDTARAEPQRLSTEQMRRRAKRVSKAAKDSKLTPTQDKILSALVKTALIERRNGWRVTYTGMAEELGVARSSVQAAVPELLKMGLMGASDTPTRGGQTRVYWLPEKVESVPTDEPEKPESVPTGNPESVPTQEPESVPSKGVKAYRVTGTLSESEAYRMTESVPTRNAVQDGTNQNAGTNNTAHVETACKIASQNQEPAQDKKRDDSTHTGGDVWEMRNDPTPLLLDDAFTRKPDTLERRILSGEFDGVPGHRCDGVGLTNLGPWLRRVVDRGDTDTLTAWEVRCSHIPLPVCSPPPVQTPRSSSPSRLAA